MSEESLSYKKRVCGQASLEVTPTYPSHQCSKGCSLKCPQLVDLRILYSWDTLTLRNALLVTLGKGSASLGSICFLKTGTLTPILPASQGQRWEGAGPHQSLPTLA